MIGAVQLVGLVVSGADVPERGSHASRIADLYAAPITLAPLAERRGEAVAPKRSVACCPEAVR